MNVNISKPYDHAVVFGVFDLFHEGHAYFLDQASLLCKSLTIVVTQDNIVEQLKQQIPHDNLETRIRAVQANNPNAEVVPGDTILGTWSVFSSGNIDMAILGYDQQGIASELTKLNIPYVYVEAYKPEYFKSSLLR